MSADRPAGPTNQGAAGLPYRLPSPCRPEAVSYDPADVEMGPVHARMTTEPGRQLRRGDTWLGHVVAWWCGPWGLGGQPEGWRRVVPCLALLSCEGELVRLFGWDAISDWCNLVMSVDRAALAGGVDIHVRSAESPAGDHWWFVVEQLGAGGEIRSEVIPDEKQPGTAVGQEDEKGEGPADQQNPA